MPAVFRLLLTALLLGIGCASPPSPVPDALTDIAGAVTRIDLSPMTYDGDAELTVRTSSGVDVEVRVPARANLCEASGLDLLGDLQVGDRVRVVGDRQSGALVPCASAEHRLVRL